ncbi:MAG: hypothetical protein IID45_01990 [Planctomycetes bacterium]|nr:hypothetical protein [Planctomycetota bacterium]
MSDSNKFSRNRFILQAGLVVAGLSLWAVYALFARNGTAYSPGPNVVPGRVVSGLSRPASVASCIDCHEEQCTQLRAAPHMRTLSRGGDPENIRRFAGKSYRDEKRGWDYRYVVRNGELFVESNVLPRAVRVDWILGSGNQSRTPVTLWNDAAGKTVLLEHAVSWYPKRGLGATLGFGNADSGTRGINALGKVLPHAESVQCLSCHATRVPTDRDGIVDFSKLITNVRCERCHQGTQRHLDTIVDGTLTMQRWSEFSPRQSIDRCGECHRRADQFTADELTPANKRIVRFPPVGLSLSKCFLGQSSIGTKRLDCTTCHNPHQKAETEHRGYNRVCLTCHSGKSGGRESEQPFCSLRPQPTRSSDCVRCHMPKTDFAGRLKFTDHWIRKRRR